ncbi:hypothetical protein [Pendulispora albinea]|uniref:Uncharacterized protein n=1 Tax=Pendulispora albinea TaxID=2741071 RepID=A0ABZ2MC47_9BACT
MHRRTLAHPGGLCAALSSLLLLGAAQMGCSGGGPTDTSSQAPLDEAPFLAIKRTAAGSSFYLAVHKRVLGERWFLTGPLQQMFPGVVSKGAAGALGIRVVTFRVRGGRLFMFGASDNYASSGTFDPALVVDSYPIVSKDSTADALNLRDHYVLVDPAPGRSD